jgi:two-component system sensor histidine kinase YesM
VDQEGVIVSSPDMDSIGKMFSDTFSIDNVNTTNIKEIDNKKYVITNTLSQYSGWKLYMIEPQESVISSMSTMKWWITIAISTCLLVLITLSVVLSNILTNPIKKLKMKALSLNNYEDTLNNSIDERKSKKGKINFRTKLFIMLFTMIMLPVVVLMTVSYYVSYDIVKTKSAEINLLNAKQIRINLEYYLSSFEKSVYDLYIETELNNVLRQIALSNGSAPVETENRKSLDDVLLKMVDKNRDIMYTQLFDVDKNLVANYGSSKQDIPEYIFEEIDKYDEAKNIWCGSYLNYFKQNVITLGKKIRDLNDFISTGYMFVSLKESDLEGVYRNFNSTQNLSYIVDDEGYIISHPNKNLINTKAEGDLLTAQEENSEQTIIRGTNNGNIMVSIDTIRNTGWKVVHISSMSTVSQNMKKMLTYFMIVLLLTCVLIAAITFRVSRRIGRPLNELGRRVSKFANGDMTLEDEEFTTGDEIEQLNNSFNNMMQRIRSLIEEVYEAKIRKHEAELNSKEAELTLLQAQINPHFLYNTLEIIRWKAMFLTDGENEVAEIVSTLSDFFRLSLSKGNKIISLKDEIDHAKNYITIMNYRYPNKIVVEWYVDESMLDRKVPKIVLQPVIENAIYHGIKPKVEQGVIDVYIRRKDNNIELVVKDNGAGMSSETVESLNGILSGAETEYKGGYGLRNVNQRIKLIFGDNYGIKISSTLGVGTCVCIYLPEVV